LIAEPDLRECVPREPTHVYEVRFALPPCLQAGLELEWGTSPPVLRRVPGWRPWLFEPLGERLDLEVEAGASSGFRVVARTIGLALAAGA
jgi:hypothetical protein